METEKRPITSLAFEYGFNSKENFIRAFKTEHHILPTAFKSVQNSLKLYNRITLEHLPFEVTARFVTLKPFRVVVCKSDECFAPHFWNKYNTKQWSKKLSGGGTVEDFGISSWNLSRNAPDYYIGRV